MCSVAIGVNQGGCRVASHTTGQIVYVDGGYTHLDRKCTESNISDFGAADAGSPGEGGGETA